MRLRRLSASDATNRGCSRNSPAFTKISRCRRKKPRRPAEKKARKLQHFTVPKIRERPESFVILDPVALGLETRGFVKT